MKITKKVYLTTDECAIVQKLLDTGCATLCEGVEIQNPYMQGEEVSQEVSQTAYLFDKMNEQRDHLLALPIYFLEDTHAHNYKEVGGERLSASWGWWGDALEVTDIELWPFVIELQYTHRFTYVEYSDCNQIESLLNKLSGVLRLEKVF